jgi:predicted permease
VPLPRLVTWLLSRAAPASRADAVVADLEDDYRVRRTQSGFRRWLARETFSLLLSYGMMRLAASRRSVPLWLRDLQMVMRGLRRGAAPLVAAGGLLGVGIAALLLTWGLAHVLLLRPVSSVHPESLQRIVAVDRQGQTATRFSFVEMQAIRDHVGDTGEIAAVYLQPVVVRVSGIDVQTMVEIVDGRYFALTGTQARTGRVLLAIDDRRDAAPTVVISEPFWRRHLNASPAALGSSLRLNGTAYTVVGVAATTGSSTFLGASVDAWVTLSHADPLLNTGWRTNIRDRWFTAFVLPTGDSAAVDQQLAATATALARVHGDPWPLRQLRTADATVVIGSQRTAASMLTLVLGGLAALILAAAASNVSGVLLARAAANERSAAIHLSIGAGRAAVMRRQLIEGALLGAISGVVGIAVYVVARNAIAEISILPTLALRVTLPFNAATTTLAIVPGLITGVLLALGPALWSTRLDVTSALRDGEARSTGGGRVTRVRRLLVSTQVCLSIVLVIGAVLFVRSVDSLTRTDLGFPREQLVAMDFDVEPIVPPGDLPALAGEALDRIAQMPMVSAAAMSNRAPVDQSTPVVELQLPGQRSTRIADVTMSLATQRYFETVGVPMVSGRAFSATEVATAADVVVINETLARRLFPGGDVIGRVIELPHDTTILQIVGVARDAKYRTLTESSQPHIYRPTPPTLGLTLLVRARADARATLLAVQRELDAVGPGVVGFFPRTLQDHLAVQLLPARAAARAATVLGALALSLTAAALYALVAWFVVLRRREIGVRMALGASRSDVRRLVVRQAMRAAVPGMGVGAVGAVALGMVARSALYGVSPADPLALGAGIGTLLIVVVVASYVPSRAAARTDPVEALRQ